MWTLRGSTLFKYDRKSFHCPSAIISPISQTSAREAMNEKQCHFYP
jgi:hypothetical protein